MTRITPQQRVARMKMLVVFKYRGLGRMDKAPLKGIKKWALCLTFESFHAMQGMICAAVLRQEQEAGVMVSTRWLGNFCKRRTREESKCRAG